MADNYLERRMEDYRRGPQRAFKAPAAERSVFVVDGLSAEGEARVRQLRADGSCRVAFAGVDRWAGARLAQATGSRYYPIDPADSDAIARAIDDARSRWGDVEVISQEDV